MKEILFSCSGLTVGTLHKVQAEQLFAVIYRGESVALVGNLHAGVSAFIQYLCGQQPRRAGILRFDGATVAEQAEQRLRQRIFYSNTPRGRFLQSEAGSITLTDYLFLMREDGCRHFFWERHRLAACAEHLIKQVGVQRHPRDKVQDLRPVEWCLLDIAKALDRDAALMVIEENFEGYSQKDLDTLARVMEKVKRQYKLSFLLNVGSRGLDQLADRCFCFEAGTIVRKISGPQIQQTVLRWMDDTLHWEQTPARPIAPTGTPLLEAKGLPCAKGRFDLKVFPAEALHLVEYDLPRKEQIFRILSGQEKCGAELFYKGKPLPVGWNFRLYRYPIVAVENLTDEAQFPNLSVQQNLLFLSVRRLCAGGFWLPPKGVFKTAEREWEAPRRPMPARMEQLTELEKLDLQMENLYLFHPDVVIFRDPFATVDGAGRQLLLKAFDRLRARGTAVVVLSSSHTSYLGSSDYQAANWYDRLVDLAEVTS